MFHLSTFCEQHSCELPLKITHIYYISSDVIVTHKTESLHVSSYENSAFLSKKDIEKSLLLDPSLIFMLE